MWDARAVPSNRSPVATAKKDGLGVQERKCGTSWAEPSVAPSAVDDEPELTDLGRSGIGCGTSTGPLPFHMAGRETRAARSITS